MLVGEFLHFWFDLGDTVGIIISNASDHRQLLDPVRITLIYLPLKIFQGFCHVKTVQVNVVRSPVTRDEPFHWTVPSPELCLPSCIPLEIALKESSLGTSVESRCVNITHRDQCSYTILTVTKRLATTAKDLLTTCRSIVSVSVSWQ